jgi:hypothetical protein
VKVIDESLWQELAGELKSDSIGEAFHDFVVEWCDRAEALLEQGWVSPLDALRISLAIVEDSHERKTIWIVGQALVLICMHWVHGTSIAQEFTEFEARLVEDVTAMKIAQLQEQAEGAAAL